MLKNIMSKVRNAVATCFSKPKALAAAALAGAGTLMTEAIVHAAPNQDLVDKVTTGITTAQDTGMSVGGLVLGAIAVLAVIGICAVVIKRM